MVSNDPASDLPAAWIACGKRIAWLRRSAGMSQSEMGRQLNIHQTAISRWEKGERLVPRDAAIAISNRFYVTTDFIFEGKIAGLRREWLEKLATEPEDLGLVTSSTA